MTPRRTTILLLLLAGTTGSTSTLAQPYCPGVAPWVFADVQASSTFCASITWMAQNSVTLGCGVIDPANRLYCPLDFVTREQMAAFMKRQADAVMPPNCAPGQVMKWNGAAWACANDSIGGSGGGGTVTSVLAGTGLQGSPNPIVGAGSINLAASYQLPQSCINGQVPKSNGAGGWTCGADSTGTGTVTSVATGAGLTGGPITAAGTIAIATGGVTATMLAQSGCTGGQVLKWSGSAWACAADAAGPANAFVQGGNVFGAEAVLGTISNHALDLRVNGARVMRYEPDAISSNVIGGSPANGVVAGVRGATIAGGGVPANADPDFDDEAPNRVTDAYGTVGGGVRNQAGDGAGTTRDRSFATVGGGYANTASGFNSTVGGGANNNASGLSATVGGGGTNTASAQESTIGGGVVNTASGLVSTIGGGYANVTASDYGTAGGGFQNTVSGLQGTISGGAQNTASGVQSSVGGGGQNTASGSGSTIAGGVNSTATGSLATIAGGNGNVAVGSGSSIGGGGYDGASNLGNFAQAAAATIAGGLANAIAADGTYGTIGGGRNNQITAPPGTNIAIATIGGGRDNTITRGGATIAGGNGNSASGFDAAIGGGISNQAGGNQGTVPGGQLNAATGDFSFAAGRRAKAVNQGCFAWGDSTNADMLCNVSDRFVVRASGGVYLYTNGVQTTGVFAAAGSGTWSSLSDRAVKANVEPVDVHDVLARVAGLPISTWNYNTQESAIRHLGPMAQDFRAAFHLGENDTTIATVDAQGVALAAIQGLNAKLEQREASLRAEVEAKHAEIGKLKREMAELRLAVEVLMAGALPNGAVTRTR